MTRRTQEIRPFSFAGIERGIGAIEARGIRKEEQAREEARVEQARLDRITQQGFQGVAAQQRQQGLDIQQQQLVGQIQARQQEQLFKEQQAAEEQEFRESQARIGNNLAIINALPKGIPAKQKLGFLQNVFSDLDMDDNPLAGVDLTQIDVDDASKDVTEVWKSFEDGKINKSQLEIAMQTVFAKHSESAAAKSAATTASAIARGGEATARTGIAAGVGGTRNVERLENRSRSLVNRLNQVNEEEEFILQGAARKRVQDKLERVENLLDVELGIAEPTPVTPTAVTPTPSAPPTTPAPTAPEPTPAPPQVPPPVELPEFVQGIEAQNFYEALVAANNGKIPSEKEFKDALQTARENRAKKEEELRARQEQQALTAGGKARVVTPTKAQLKRGAKATQRALK